MNHKPIVAVILIVCVVLTTPLMALAIKKGSIENSKVQVVNGRLKYNENLQNVIDEYFSIRVRVFNKNTKKDTQTENLSSFTKSNSTLMSKELERLSALSNLEKAHGVYVISAKNSAFIQNVSLAKEKDNYDKEKKYISALVYEWTWIEYNDGKEGKIDEMGYATIHDITIEENKNGIYTILDDNYDESAVLGYSTGNESKDLSSKQIDNNSFVIQGVNSNVTLNVNNLIDYADKWVIHEYPSTMQNPNYYNKNEYGYYSSDCCNYTSQCLKVGGMSFDYGSGKDNNNWDGTQWWFDRYPNPQYENYNVSPPSWRYVPKFIEYWENQGFSKVSATSSSVYPGNPVINGTNHVGICVGYNSSGTPIINGHNRDMYHVPYTMIGSGTRSTIQLTTSNLMLNKPSNAAYITPTTSNQTETGFVFNQESDYYKFTVATSGYYTLESTYYSGYSLDTYGYLYKETYSSNGQTLYLYEIAKNDDGGNNTNFKIRKNLSPGTYYVRVRSYSGSTTGFYYLNYKKG